MNAYIYVRFSTLEQAKGSSLERQLRDCRAFCDRRGWVRSEARELIDEGRSAFDGSNRTGDGALAEFERAVRAGEVPAGSVLVVERLDRVSRQSPFEVFRFISAMLDAGICLAVASNERVYVEKMGFDQLIDMIVTAKLSNEESEKKSERLKAAWVMKRRMAGEGRPLTAMCPSWLRIDSDARQYVVVEDKAALVREVYEMAAAGFGRGLIAATLNQRGVPPLSGRSKGWHPSFVQKILCSRAVLGEFQLHRTEAGARVADGEPLTGFFPRIVDDDLYARAQAARAGRATMAGRRGPRIANLFSGIAKCSACGGTMTYRDKAKPGEQYLVCDSALRRRGCESRSYFRYDAIESRVLDELLELAVDDRRASATDAVSILLRNQATAAAAIASIEARRARLIDLLSRGEDPDAEKLFRDLGAELAEQRRAVEAMERQIVEARGAVPPDVHLGRIQEARRAIASDEPAVRLPARAMAQQALRQLVDTIVCCGAGEHVTVSVLNGLCVFRFSRGVGEMMARSSDVEQLAGRPDVIGEYYADGDAQRERALAEVAARARRARRRQGLGEAELAEAAPETMAMQRALGGGGLE